MRVLVRLARSIPDPVPLRAGPWLLDCDRSSQPARPPASLRSLPSGCATCRRPAIASRQWWSPPCVSPERDSHLPRARLLLRNERAPRQSSKNPPPTRAKGPFARTSLEPPRTRTTHRSRPQPRGPHREPGDSGQIASIWVRTFRASSGWAVTNRLRNLTTSSLVDLSGSSGVTLACGW